MTVATIGTLASRTLFLDAAPDSIVAVAPTALVSPPEYRGAPSVFTTAAVMQSVRRGAFAPAAALVMEQAGPDDVLAVAQSIDLPPWDATVQSGDTLDQLLSDAEMEPQMRAEVALALTAEYDLRRLRPGHRLNVGYQPDGTPSNVTLAVDDGVLIEVRLGDTITSRTVTQSASMVERAGQLEVNGSIYMSLERAGVPASFAVDLAETLRDTVDFRRDLRGGESLNILWDQPVLSDGSVVGQPSMTYVALDLADNQFEVLWSEGDSERATVYVNGEILRTVARPVEGARLSSVFGQRRHPIYGNVRMHTGVDYAAAEGTPIAATAAGRISFIGWRNGYGRVVEIAHGSDTMTRYAHLSAVADGMAVGRRVVAGEKIGEVGETGTATAPNLHYEVRVGGQPIDPLGEELLASAENNDIDSATEALEETRTRFVAVLQDET